MPTRAHNDLLHTLATQGLVGGIAFLLLAGTLAWAAWRAWKFARLPDRPLVAALVAAILAWYVQNLFGFPVAPTASLFVVVAAMLSRLAWPRQARRASEESQHPSLARRACMMNPAGPEQARRASEESQHPSLARRASMQNVGVGFVQVAILVGGVSAAWTLVARPYLAGCACRQGEEVRAAASQQSLEWHEYAVKLDPQRDVLWIKLTECSLALAEVCPDKVERQRLLMCAREAIEESCRLVPVSGQNQANRSRVLHALAREGLARPADVLAAFDEALVHDPENAALLADAAGAAVGLGFADRAAVYLQRGLRLDPTLGILHSTAAALALSQRRHQEAEAELGKAFQGEWHANAEALDRAKSMLCLTYLDTGRAGQALQVAEDMLSRNNDSLSYHCLRRMPWRNSVGGKKHSESTAGLLAFGRIIPSASRNGPSARRPVSSYP